MNLLLYLVNIQKKYNSFAYTTIINNEKVVNETATQIFTKQGPLAYLPISNLQTSVVYSVHNDLNNKKERRIGNNSLMFSGNIMLSKKWKIGGSSGYDFKNKGFTYTQLRFERDLDSWKMNFNWVPFSTRASRYFFIGIKSDLLSDLKYDKRTEPDRNFY